MIYLGGRISGKVPLILNCKHTVCQECILKGAKKNNILCPVCQKPSVLQDKNAIDNLSEVFLPNYHIIGVISFSRCLKNNQLSLTLVPAEELPNKKNNTSVGLVNAAQLDNEGNFLVLCLQTYPISLRDSWITMLMMWVTFKEILDNKIFQCEIDFYFLHVSCEQWGDIRPTQHKLPKMFDNFLNLWVLDMTKLEIFNWRRFLITFGKFIFFFDLFWHPLQTFLILPANLPTYQCLTCPNWRLTPAIEQCSKQL